MLTPDSRSWILIGCGNSSKNTHMSHLQSGLKLSINVVSEKLFRNEKKFGLFCPNDNKTTPGSESGTHHGRHTCEFKGQDLKMAAAVDFAGESSQSNLK